MRRAASAKTVRKESLRGSWTRLRSHLVGTPRFLSGTVYALSICFLGSENKASHDGSADLSPKEELETASDTQKAAQGR